MPDLVDLLARRDRRAGRDAGEEAESAVFLDPGASRVERPAERAGKAAGEVEVDLRLFESVCGEALPKIALLARPGTGHDVHGLSLPRAVRPLPGDILRDNVIVTHQDRTPLGAA